MFLVFCFASFALASKSSFEHVERMIEAEKGKISKKFQSFDNEEDKIFEEMRIKKRDVDEEIDTILSELEKEREEIGEHVDRLYKQEMEDSLQQRRSMKQTQEDAFRTLEQAKNSMPER